jgi:cell division transport system permease protein
MGASGRTFLRVGSFVLATALRDLRRTGAAGVAGILLTALAAVVAGGTAMGLEALGRLMASWRADLQIVVLLGAEASGGSGSEAVLGAARGLAGVGAVRHRSADEALGELRQALGGAANGLDRLPTNPLPARIEVTPSPGLRAAALRDLVDALGRLPGVDEVQAAIGWVREAERIERALRVGGIGLAGLLAVTGALSIAGATNLARHRRSDETAVLRLGGVPEGRLRLPLVLQGLAQGGGGAALGVSVLVLTSEAGPGWVTAGVRAGLALAPLPMPGWPLAGALLLGGLVVGLVGSLGAGRP